MLYEVITQLAEAIGEQYLKILPTCTALMPHARELLDYLYEKYPLTIVSNGFEETQHNKLQSSGINHYFKHIVLSESVITSYSIHYTKLYETTKSTKVTIKMNKIPLIGSSYNFV